MFDLDPLLTMQVPDGTPLMMAVMGWDDLAYVVVMIILSLISYYLNRKKQQEPTAPKPAGIEDFTVPTAEVGREIPVLFGTRWIKSPNVVWYGNLKIEAKKEKY